MWASPLDYNFNSSAGYSPANNNSFFTNSFSDNDIKINDSNFSQFQQQLAISLTGGFPFIPQGVPSSPSSSDTPQMRAKKKPNPVPQEKKTHAYYERRKKNNQSAQKSRNERRRREQENMLRIGQLEQENNMLRTMLQQMESKLKFQDIQLHSLQLQPRPVQQHTQPSTNNSSSTNAIEASQQASSISCNAATPMPFTNQMNMLMNSY